MPEICLSRFESEQSSPASAPAVIPADSGDARRARLLAALRPMLREEKRGKLDAMTRAMTVASLFSGIRRGQRS